MTTPNSMSLMGLEEALPDVSDSSNANERKKSIAELAKNLELTAFGSAEMLRATLKEEGIDNPSKHLMKVLANEVKLFKCCKCTEVCETLRDLIMHVENELHLYGNKEYAKRRRELIKRIKERLTSENLIEKDLLPDVDVKCKKKLTDLEVSAWAGIDNMKVISGPERATYFNLIHVGVCLRKLNRRRQTNNL